MIEIYVWIATLFLCGVVHFLLATKYDPASPKFPYKEAIFLKRLSLTHGINYIAFALFSIFILARGIPSVALETIQSFWIVEIFIFWNLRTAFLCLRQY
jgi:hypothetical protein